jgi:asparagine synthase (glutamine-hydrolysing)
MCGIAGILGRDADAATARELVARMCAAMEHRGPDGGGVEAHPDATLGMKRLAIVDIARGQQPMASDDGRVVIVYNGEVYNAPALRAELAAAGVRFRTRSDTEVVLRLYERDPDDVEQHLVGMWAFAIHDRRRRRVVLSRDRFGIKPLFVADAGVALAFASELGCFAPLRARAPFDRLFAPDPGAAHAMLSWGYVPGEATIYAGVQRIAPATRLEVDLANGARVAARYWALRPAPEAARVASLGEACELVEPLLRRAVREHLESDVPVACFLSGGIDSALVTALATDVAPRPPEAFAVGFREPRFDESPAARASAACFGVPFWVEALAEVASRAALADALLAYDEPFGDSSSLATYLVARRVAGSYKVVLGGDGGDEIFAGYKKHRIVAIRDAVARFPRARDAAACALAALPARTDRSRGWADALRTARRIARGLRGDDAVAYVALTQVAAMDRTAPLAAAPADPERFEAPARARFGAAVGTQLQRTLASDLGSPLPDDMLTKVDRASMAHRLEARVPFLDHRLVEAGVGLPARFTLGTRGKEVLRVLHARRFGPALAQRRKQGFGVPVEHWLRGALAPACDALFDARRLARAGLLSAQALGGGRWRHVAATDPQLLWHAFALAAWCEATHGDGPDALRALLAPPGRGAP